MAIVEGAAMSAASSSEFGDRLVNAINAVRDRLLQSRNPDGFWDGRLSSSALSTATALSALSLARDPSDAARIALGIAWLAGSQNADGGWGDTTDSPSNLATTLLAIAALTLVGSEDTPSPPLAGTLEKAKVYLLQKHSTDTIVQAIQREYGEDRTFAVPILMNCGLAGLVAWRDIPGLPFELAVLPHSWYKAVRLHVVSYALPALIAIGLLIDRRNPPASGVRRLVRKLIAPRALQKLRHIQPDGGGFLEATPLTSFVAMALLPLLGREQPVAARCLEFLRKSQRSDGAWPIDTNLSVWLTTAAVAAFDAAGELSQIDRGQTARWIAAAQHRTPHRYTKAEPGGWAWTHLAGGVPDVDDTAGAILAIEALGRDDGVADGVHWLLKLQNADGGWPTFCRGWGKLPFDRSSPDLTAHALRAICSVARDAGDRASQRAIRRGLQYLWQSQHADGSWTPLWFGNQAAPSRANPVVGTARVLRALEALAPESARTARAVKYLLESQNADGGWGGAKGVPSSIEETALATAALTAWSSTPSARAASFRGAEYLIRCVMRSESQPVAIGLYFAHLWYSEQLYPLIWTLDALGRTLVLTRSLPNNAEIVAS
jgi:squalene-hopene/tetraprenyl-beta-curcumene cyclase